MWSDMAVDGSLSLLRTGVSFITAKRDADAKRAWQNYKNTMVALADANNQNALTTNENMARAKAVDQDFAIQRSEYLTSASAEVASAAAETGGRSVNMVMFDIERNAAAARGKVQDDLEATQEQIKYQREASAFQRATATDFSPIKEPSAANALLGETTDLMRLYRRDVNPRP